MGLIQIIVTIEVGAAQGDKQLTVTQAAGIATHPIEILVGTMQTAVDHGREFRKAEHAHAGAPCNSLRTCSISLNGSRRPAISW